MMLVRPDPPAPPAPPAPAGARLPDGFAVVLSDSTRVGDDGASLLGTTTGRFLRLRPAARDLLVDGRVAVADPASAVLARLLLDRDLADPAPVRADGDGDAAEDDDAVDDVTVVVPVRDRPESLARLLAALPPRLPVVVVDDGSVDARTGEVARAAGARVVRLDPGRGPAAARNAGAAVATTPYLALLDSDVVPVPGWLGRLRRHLEDPAVAVVAPRVLGLPGEPGRGGWLHRYEAVRSSLDLGPRPAAVRPHGQVAYLPSAALLVRRAAWGAGFDERLHVGEDVDLVWRTWAAGWRLRYEPAAVVRHEHRTEVSGWLARKAFYGTSADLLAARHGDAVAPMVLTPWTSVVALALLAQRRWSLPVAAGAYVVATAGVRRRLPPGGRPWTAAASMTAVGLVGAVWQTGAALTRHYWPLAALACLVSRRARRAVLTAAVADGLWDHRRTGADLDPVRYLLARRLDDLAYGAGVWAGAWRGRSLRSLRPALRGFNRRPPEHA